MDQLLEFLKGFSLQTIMSLVAIVWVFSKHIDSKLDKLEAKMDQQSQRTDRLYEMFIDLLKEKK